MGKERGAETQQRPCLAHPEGDLQEHPSGDYTAAKASATAQTQGGSRMPRDGGPGMLDLRSYLKGPLLYCYRQRIYL